MSYLESPMHRSVAFFVLLSALALGVPAEEPPAEPDARSLVRPLPPIAAPAAPDAESDEAALDAPAPPPPPIDLDYRPPAATPP